MVELFSIGGFSLHLFGVTIAFGILAGVMVMLYEGKRKGLNTGRLTDLAVYTLIAAMIGARLNYVIAFNPGYYLEHPLAILMVQRGGLSIQGGLIGGGVFAFWYMHRHKMEIWKTADAFAPGIIIGQAIGRVGCDVFGVPMERSMAWGVEVGGQLLHPAQMYESMLNYGLFLVLWNLRNRMGRQGQLFMVYVAGFSFNRMFVEFFRTNPMVAGPFSIAHVYSLIMMAAGVAGFLWLGRSREKTQSTVANDTNTGDQFNWKTHLIIFAAMVVSVLVYYQIHG